jgi:broad specificity phosphatase PhoE
MIEQSIVFCPYKNYNRYMKWPESLSLVRHDVSAFNQLHTLKSQDPVYQEFRSAYDQGQWSDVTEQLAYRVMEHFALEVGDHDTPLVPVEEGQKSNAELMASNLRNKIQVPDTIFVSPYKRTHQTLERMMQGGPELSEVRVVEEDRIREQDHGLALIYNDWRVFNTIHPEQRKLRDREGSYWYRFPQGENVPDVRERLRSWLGTVSRDYYEKNLLAVTHHLAILSLRANLERWSDERFIEVDTNEKPINAGVTIYRGDSTQGTDGHLVLDVYNALLYP